MVRQAQLLPNAQALIAQHAVQCLASCLAILAVGVRDRSELAIAFDWRAAGLCSPAMGTAFRRTVSLVIYSAHSPCCGVLFGHSSFCQLLPVPLPLCQLLLSSLLHQPPLPPQLPLLQLPLPLQLLLLFELPLCQLPLCQLLCCPCCPRCPGQV